MKLMAISDAPSRGRFASGGFGRWLDALVEAGVDAVQVREKAEPIDRLFARVERAVERIGDRAEVWVNGRADVALAAGARGVHLPSRGLPPAPLRRRFGKALGIGVACHRLDEIADAARIGVDYVTFSPIFPTPSKPDGSVQGLGQLRQACKLGVPVMALGGITVDRFAAVSSAGAAGVAGIRVFHDPAALREIDPSNPGRLPWES